MLGKKDISIKLFYAISALLIVAKLVLVYTQVVTVQPQAAPIDDHLMYTLANNIAQGNWLGEYNYLTLSKHSFFAVFLALLNILHIPFTVGTGMLWAAASVVFIMAISPLIQKNYVKLIIFAAMLYNPATWAGFNTRIYRDSIFPALCLIFFSTLAAVALRYNKEIKKWLPYLILFGISFGLIYLTREDGIWVAPFWVIGVVIIIITMLIQKVDMATIKSIIIVFVPIILSVVVISSYAFMNYKHYGRFIISDFSQGEFKQAYGAMASVKQEKPVDMVTVNTEVRFKLYEEVPTFALLEEQLESSMVKNAYYTKNLKEYKAGAFYWAVRLSAQLEGFYDTPEKAQQFYNDIYNEIILAQEEGRLEIDGKIRKSLNPKITLDLFAPTFKEAFNSFKAVMLFEQTDPVGEISIGEPEQIKEVEEFIHQSGTIGYIENTDIVYVSPIRKISYGIMNIISMFYSILIPITFIFAVIWQINKFIKMFKAKTFDKTDMLNVILLGFLFMAVFRIFMIAFIEVASFGIGTYIMYLSTVHPLIIAYSAIGSYYFIKDTIENKKIKV